MTETEYKTEFSMWAILASSMIVTTPIVNCSSTDAIHGKYTPGKCKAELTDLQKEILLNKEVIAINQDVTLGGRLLNSEEFRWSNGTDCAVVQQISNVKCERG